MSCVVESAAGSIREWRGSRCPTVEIYFCGQAGAWCLLLLCLALFSPIPWRQVFGDDNYELKSTSIGRSYPGELIRRNEHKHMFHAWGDFSWVVRASVWVKVRATAGIGL